MMRDRAEKEPWESKDSPLIVLARRAARAALPDGARFTLYFRVLNTPVLSELYVRGRGRLRHRRISSRTRIVVEAFPSSGSTYCRQSTLLANPTLQPNQLCSHTHAPRVVLRATRAGLPVVVVARDPRDAVASAVQRFPGVRLLSAFRYYERYYRQLLPVKSHIVVAPFDVVITDFSAVIEQLNAKYGTEFASEADVGLTRADVFADIDGRAHRQHGERFEERRVSRPTAARKHSDEVLAHLSHHETRALEAAQEAYALFIVDAQGAAATQD